MKVTENQIQQIYTFTQRLYVEWFDVQTELVDYLANGIESQWRTNPNIAFEYALSNEFKKFGLFGFQDLVEEKRKALNKYYFIFTSLLYIYRNYSKKAKTKNV